MGGENSDKSPSSLLGAKKGKPDLDDVPKITPKLSFAKSVSKYRDKVLLAAQELKKNQEETAQLAAYYVEDAWAGRLENGLGKNSKKSPDVFAAFKIQTGPVWTNVNLLSILCHSMLALWPQCATTHVLSFLCILVFMMDIGLKMWYMTVKTYLSKQWQWMYVVLVSFLLLETLVSLVYDHGVYAVYCIRPTLLCLRERSIRRFFTVVKEMIPGFLHVCAPLFFFLVMVAAGAHAGFRDRLPAEEGGTPARALYGYWTLIATGDTYGALLPDALKESPVYLACFFATLVVGNLFLLSMLMGVTFDTFIEHTKEVVNKERLKELKGLLKAFTILDADQAGYINQDQYDRFLRCLRPQTSDTQRLLYFELAAPAGETKISAIEFLDLKNVLSYEFANGGEQQGLRRVRSAAAVGEGGPARRLLGAVVQWADDALHHPWFGHAALGLAVGDLLLLLLEHEVSWGPAAGQVFLWAYLAETAVRAWAQRGPRRYLRECSGHEVLALACAALEVALHCGLAGVLAGARWVAPPARARALAWAQRWRAHPGRAAGRRAAALGRRWRLVARNRNLAAYFGCFAALVPVLLQTLSFALIIAYFFAMLGLQAYHAVPGLGYFACPRSAVFTMLQLFFGVDVAQVVEDCTAHGSKGLGVVFFVTYFIIGVIIIFNLINTIIIQFYGETMDSTSQDYLEEQKAADAKLEQMLLDRLREKMVLSTMTGGGFGKGGGGANHGRFLWPSLKITRAGMHLSGATMRRRLTGQAAGISTEELRAVQKFAAKYKYKVDLLKLYTESAEGPQGAKEFEQTLYRELCARVAKLGRREYGPGDAVVRMGEICNHCFFVDAGAVDVYYGNRLIRTVGKGHMFGEDMLLSGLPHPFDVKAQAGTAVLVFDRKTFLNDFTTDMQGQFANKAVRSVIENEKIARKISSQEFVRQFSKTLSRQNVRLQSRTSRPSLGASPRASTHSAPGGGGGGGGAPPHPLTKQISAPLQRTTAAVPSLGPSAVLHISPSPRRSTSVGDFPSGGSPKTSKGPSPTGGMPPSPTGGIGPSPKTDKSPSPKAAAEAGRRRDPAAPAAARSRSPSWSGSEAEEGEGGGGDGHLVELEFNPRDWRVAAGYARGLAAERLLRAAGGVNAARFEAIGTPTKTSRRASNSGSSYTGYMTCPDDESGEVDSAIPPTASSIDKKKLEEFLTGAASEDDEDEEVHHSHGPPPLVDPVTEGDMELVAGVEGKPPGPRISSRRLEGKARPD